MEPSRNRQMDKNTNLLWLQYRVQEETALSDPLPDFLPLPQTDCCYGQGNKTTVEERGNRILRQRYRILQSNICCPKKGWWLAPHYQSEGPKQLCGDETFQNGRDIHPTRYFEARRLHRKNRFQRCIFQCEDRYKTQEVPTFPMEGQILSVQSSAFWASNCTSSVHQGDERSSESPERERHSVGTLPRRHLDPRGDTQHMPDLSFGHSSLAEETGVCAEHKEIHFLPPNGDRIPRVPNQFSQKPKCTK